MNRYQYFLKALDAECYKWKAWINRTFAVSNLPTTLVPGKEDYPYQLFNKDGMYAFYEPGTENIVVIDNGRVDEPLIYASEPITLKAGDVPNLTKDLTTSCGNVLFNYAVLVYSTGNIIPFIDGDVNLNDVEKTLAKLTVDDVPEADRNPNVVYTYQLKKYIKAASNLAGLSNLFVPSATPFTVRAAPGYKELREKLIEENKDRLNDPTVISMIGEALEKLDREWIASDPDKGFYVKEKQFASNRKKMFYMHGVEYEFDGSGKITFIPNSLNEGWDISKLPAMANSIRDGSFSRGALTALGGEKTKTIFRVMSGSVVSEEDCGTKLGLKIAITKNNHKLFSGNFVKTPEEKTWVKLTEEDTAQYIDKDLIIRSPGYCNTVGADYCKACLGDFIRGKENTIANECASVGSQMLSLFLAAFHAKALKTTTYDIKKTLS